MGSPEGVEIRGLGDGTDATLPWGQDQARGNPAGWQREIDTICDRFEEDWLDGRVPRIEEILAASVLPSSQKADALARASC